MRRPTLAGAARVGTQLTCRRGTWTGATRFALQWLRNGKAIARATKATYRLRAVDAGTRVSCRVRATGPGGTVTATSAAVRVKMAPVRCAGARAAAGAFGRR